MPNLESLSKFNTSVSEITNIYYKSKFDKYVKRKNNILDFGCGTGEFLQLFNCTKKIGVEINKFSLKKLKDKKIKYVNKVEYLSKNIKFDTIFALSVIDHLNNPISIIKKLKNKLKKNGQIIIILRHDNKNQNSTNSWYKEHLYSWSLLSFNNLLNSIGLKSVDEGAVKMTLPPRFLYLRRIIGVKSLIVLSKLYYYFNFRDRRFYFICKKK